MIVFRAFFADDEMVEVVDIVVIGVDIVLDFECVGCVEVGESHSRYHRVEDKADEQGHNHVTDWSHCFDF